MGNKLELVSALDHVFMTFVRTTLKTDNAGRRMCRTPCKMHRQERQVRKEAEWYQLLLRLQSACVAACVWASPAECIRVCGCASTDACGRWKSKDAGRLFEVHQGQTRCGQAQQWRRL